MKTRTQRQRIKDQRELHYLKCNVKNGISHGNLTEPAFSLLRGTLESYGNILSDAHQTALLELLGALSNFARGDLKGRRVYALSTGLGKSTAVLSWIVALHRLGEAASGVSIAVAATKVEALCGMKRALLAAGVPESDIGLKHSLGAAASMPSTGDSDRRFLLITHQRVRGGGNPELFTEHKGKPRAVLIYDESLFRADCLAISERDVRSELAYMVERTTTRSDCAGLISYLTEARDIIVNAVNVAKSGRRDATTITLPVLNEIQQLGFTELLRSMPMADSLSQLVTVAGDTLRVAITEQNEGVLWHRVSIPEKLKNVLVLDASYPIRTLCKLDKTLKPGSRFSETVKRFDNVKIHQMFAHSGRNSIEASFREKRREGRAISREVVSVIKNIPQNQGILIFTFKTRAVDFKRILLDDLQAAGVDVDAVRTNGKPRINIATWGEEVGINDFSHVENVLLAGVIHRSLLDVASMIVGQQDDSKANIDGTTLHEMVRSEISHSLFQAASRGCCREINDGQAKPMQVWLIYPDLSIRRPMLEVMPGAVWDEWVPTEKVGRTGAVAGMTLRVSEHLQKLPATTRTISTRVVKAEMGISDHEKDTFTRSLKELPELSSEWVVVDRSLVRNDATHHGF